MFAKNKQDILTIKYEGGQVARGDKYTRDTLEGKAEGQSWSSAKRKLW